jgi:hypothetical protein
MTYEPKDSELEQARWITHAIEEGGVFRLDHGSYQVLHKSRRLVPKEKYVDEDLWEENHERTKAVFKGIGWEVPDAESIVVQAKREVLKCKWCEWYVPIKSEELEKESYLLNKHIEIVHPQEWSNLEGKEDLIEMPCLFCGKPVEVKETSYEARGIFNVFCPGGNCEDLYAISQ